MWKNSWAVSKAIFTDGNPLTVAADKILDIKVVETFKEGKTTFYKRDPAA